MATLAELLVKIGADVTGFQQGMGTLNADLLKLDKQISDATSGFDKFGARLENIGSTLMGIGAGLTAALTVPLAGVSVAALKVASDMEQAAIGFSTMLGGADKAKVFLEQLRDFALKTPFELPGLIQASQRLMAMGFAARDVVPMMRAIGDSVAALGGSQETLNRVVTAMGQIQAKGRLMAEEMRQLAESGIPAWQMLAKHLKVDVATAMEMVTAKAVDSATAIEALTKGMTEQFGGLMERQAKTLGGMWSNFKDTITKTLDSIGQAIAPLAKQILQWATEAVQGVEKLAAGFAQLPQPVQMAAIALAGLAAAAGPVLMALGGLTSAGGSLLRGWAQIAPLFGSAATGAGLLGAALPPVAIAIAAVASAFAAMKIGNAVAEFAEVTGIAPAVREALDSIGESIGKVARSAVEAVPGLQEFGNAVESFFTRIGAEFKKRFSWTDLIPGTQITTGLARALDDIANLIGDKTVLIAAKVKAAAQRGMVTAVDTIAEQTKKQVDALFKSGLTGAFDTLSVKTSAQLKAQADNLKAAFAQIQQAFKAGTVDQATYARAQAALAKGMEDLYGKTKKVHEAIKALKFDQMGAQSAVLAEEWRQLQKAMDDLEKSIAKHNLHIAEVIRGYQQLEGFGGSVDFLTASWAQMVTELDKVAPEIDYIIAKTTKLSEIKSPSDFWAPVAEAIKRTKDALDSLGGESSEALRGAVDKARAHWEEMVRIYGEGSHNALVALRNLYQAQKDEALKTGQEWTDINQKTLETLEKQTGAHTEKQEKTWGKLGQQISTIFTDLSKSLADLIFQGGKFGEIMVNVAKDIGKAIVRYIIEEAMNSFIAKIKEAGGLWKALFDMSGPNYGVPTPKVPTPPTAQAPLPTPSGTTPSVPAPTTGGGGAGGFDITGWGTLIASAVSAITGVLQYLQGRRMEQDIGRIEVTTRGILNEHLNLRADEWDREAHLMAKLDDIWSSLMHVDQSSFEILRIMQGGGPSWGENEGKKQAERDRQKAEKELTDAMEKVGQQTEHLTAELDDAGNEIVYADRANTAAISDLSVTFDGASTEITQSVSDLGDTVQEASAAIVTASNRTWTALTAIPISNPYPSYDEMLTGIPDFYRNYDAAMKELGKKIADLKANPLVNWRGNMLPQGSMAAAPIHIPTREEWESRYPSNAQYYERNQPYMAFPDKWPGYYFDFSGAQLGNELTEERVATMFTRALRKVGAI